MQENLNKNNLESEGQSPLNKAKIIMFGVNIFLIFFLIVFIFLYFNLKGNIQSEKFLEKDDITLHEGSLEKLEQKTTDDEIDQNIASDEITVEEKFCLDQGGKIEEKRIEKDNLKICFINDGVDEIRCELDLFYKRKCGESLNTYNNDDKTYSFRYPEVFWPYLLNRKTEGFTITTENEIRQNFDTIVDSQGGACPGVCGRLTSNPDLLQKQFDILAGLEEKEICSLTDEEKEDIEKNFMLFNVGISSKKVVEAIETSRGVCALKVVDIDGYDASLSNVYYKLSFLKEGVIVNHSFHLFPHNIITTNNLWKEIGYDVENGSCDGECYEKEVEYLENLDLEKGLEKTMISIYDQISRSVDLKTSSF